MDSALPTTQVKASEGGGTRRDTLTITDNRTGQKYDVPITDGTIRAMDLRKIKVAPDDFGLMTYDPALMNTASTKSAITFIDGDKGILRYRGYPIQQLAEKCVFLEVAYLVLFGELPTEPELKEWTDKITYHTMLHENTKKFLGGFHHDAHPMSMFISTVAAPPRFIRTPEMCSNRRCASCKSIASSGKFRLSPPTATATASASPTCIRTTI